LPTDYWVVFGKPATPTALTDPANWGNELRLTDQSFDLEKALFLGDGDTVPGLFLGDYEGLKAVGNDFAAAFCVAGILPSDPKSVFFRRIIAVLPMETASTATNDVAATLTSQQLDSLRPEAIHRGQGAGVDTAALPDIDLRIGDLGGTTLGLASGDTVWLDAYGAASGWFTDLTSWEIPSSPHRGHRVSSIVSTS
jgi:hypothetical protein